jgi:hypothetical protein
MRWWKKVVRLQCVGDFRRHGEHICCAVMAMYRFEDGRIAEDWGLPVRADWP